ncbi:HAMP domain-containing sensor histidine kinase [Cysteiniphilum sp. QT6929]|uniref:sensor histidine kinase n=1 Tax=Cysteiniphilum sp. QT6929 TaxID=2975055 RepID=UPI0024B355E4|nr:HAMP domain-containing sensor histidine kinase [Cysteiniphilum sp. QT6929]WHN65085.1 HAMP domain-containing histidine kinase [Cysteiniphilum sp. QT6929]
MKKYLNLLCIFAFFCLSLISISYLFISAYRQINEDIHAELHHKIAWEIAKIVKYGEDEDLKSFIQTFDSQHFSDIQIQRIELEMALSTAPQFHPDYTIKNAQDLENKILQHQNNTHKFSVFIHKDLWLNIHAVKNYHYFFSLFTAEFAIILLIVILLLFACWLLLRLYRLTELSQQMLIELGLPQNTSIYFGLISGPKALFEQMKLRIHNLTRTRSQLMSSISHDIKTPLTRMRFRLEQLELKGDTDAIKSMADIDHINEVVQSFLSLSNLHLQQRKKIDLNLMLLTLQDNYADMGHRIDYTETPESIVYGSAQVYNRILTNILDNAFRFADRVDISLTQTKQLIELIIIDHGQGVAHDKLNKITQLGFSENNIDAKKHYGLGLAIVHELVSLTGGTIIFENDHILGLRVTMTWAK